MFLAKYPTGICSATRRRHPITACFDDPLVNQVSGAENPKNKETIMKNAKKKLEQQHLFNIGSTYSRSCGSVQCKLHCAIQIN